MNHNQPSLSAIIVAGPCRQRAQRVVNAICSQTRIDDMEVIIVDLASLDAPPLQTKPNVPTTYIQLPETTPWGMARSVAVRQANSNVVAFIEDHCYPAPKWAEALIEAHKEDWVAVGYAFTNANPQTYMGRAAFFSDYSYWMHPAERGQNRFLPGNNISYKRDVLFSFGDRLNEILSPDFIAQEIFYQRGLPMFIESRAIAAHENYINLLPFLQSNHVYCRLLAANRVRIQAWGKFKRLFYGVAVLTGAPLLKMLRLVQSLRHRPTLWSEFISAFPVLVITYLWSAVGESLGYLFGEGNAEREFYEYELANQRTPEELILGQ